MKSGTRKRQFYGVELRNVSGIFFRGGRAGRRPINKIRERGGSMDQKMKSFILKQMKGHDSMTVATVRTDGWPQATTVVYVNDGLNLYFCCDPDGQKVRNIARCDKVSATIDRDDEDWSELQGLSLAARAKVVKDKKEIGRVMKLFGRKFPAFSEVEVTEPSDMAVVKLVPKVISVIDYRKGFGHTDLVRP